MGFEATLVARAFLKECVVSGPLGVMSVILLEAAVGGAVVLWASGVHGAVRRGFFLLMGGTVALCALGAWAVARPVLVGLDPGGDRAALGLGVFAAATVVWQVLLVARQDRVARVTGLAATATGVVALVLFGLVREGSTALGLVELALGSLFLGSTAFGLLLGHWYLVERRLSNRYMIRSAWFYIVGVLAAGVGAWIGARDAATSGPTAATGFSPILAVQGFPTLLAFGLLAVCALIAFFVWKLAQEGGRSIQAATGMFYLAVIMAFSAEMSAKIGFF